ncbi:hypothetical protein [Nesterenkonia sp. NBAIMH1]|uniref:hypothetical protein n=1 Tax=Nesterenkonia sp. NBAIMH1 TaxID=2600320 RepID=UPI0011B43986|nr:hypothetical protein [Nesterenkonia sp. NBAIMH1]
MPRAGLLGACVTIGVVLGIIGTALHGNIWMVGEAGSLALVPWGVLVALGLLLAAQLWAGTTARAALEPMVMGASAFTVATAAYIWPGPDQLVIPYNELTWEAMPGPVLVSLLWWGGTAAVTAASMLLTQWVLAQDDLSRRRADVALDRHP